MTQALKNSLKSFKAWVFQRPLSGTKAAPAKTATNTLTDFNPAFEIRPSLNKGLGVFAKRPIPRAFIIMRDRLVLRYDQREEPQQTYRRFERLPRPIQEEVLKLAVVRDVEFSMAVGQYLLLKGV